MADQTNDDAPTADRADTPGAVAAVQPPKRHSGTLIAITTLICVLALAAAGFFFLQQLREKQAGLGGRLSEENQQLAEITKQMTSLQSHIATIQSQLATMESKLATGESRYERALADFSEKHSQKLSQLKAEHDQELYRLRRQLGKTRGDWLIADAEYLLSVANQRLQLIGDVKTTRLALEAADERLRESGDPAVYKVREAIAQELGVLKEVKPPDVVGIFSRLRALEKQSRDLPVFLPHAGKVTKEGHISQPGKGEAAEPDAGSIIDSAIEDIKDLIEIRRVDRAIEAILTPEEVELIRQDLRLDFEMARLALLQHDETLYTSTLQEAREWLNKHFDTKQAATKRVLAEIEKLLKEPVSVDYPDIGRSLTLLKQIAKLRLEKDKAILDDENTVPGEDAGADAPATTGKGPNNDAGERP